MEIPEIDMFFYLSIRATYQDVELTSNSANAKFFAKKNISQIFSKNIKDTIASISDSKALELGFDKSCKIGAHTLRHSLLSYLLSFPGGSNQLYSIISTGESLGGAVGVYVKMILEGMNSVGRLKSGLQTTHSNYCSIPPLFKTNAVVNMSDFVPNYNNIPASYKQVLYNTFPLLIWQCNENMDK